MINMSEWAARQQNTILVKEATVHCVACVNVLAHGMVHEAHRSNHWNLSTEDILFIDNAPNPTEVICVGMGDDNSSDRPFT